MFQYAEFAKAIDEDRHRRELRWIDVAEQAGLAKSTINRVAHGKTPDVDTVAKLLEWSGLSADTFFTHPKERAQPTLPQVAVLIKTDESLSDLAKAVIVDVLATMYRYARSGT